MSKRNVTNTRLNKLIESITQEITIAKTVNYEEAEQAVKQLIDIAGSAALALGFADAKFSFKHGYYEFSLTTKHLDKMVMESSQMITTEIGDVRQ